MNIKKKIFQFKKFACFKDIIVISLAFLGLQFKA